MAEEYPKRESHFAHKLTRALLRTCAAQDIGSAACHLVIQIAHTEDAAHYRRPVTWWNEQLGSVLGLSHGQLTRARKRAIDGGWLRYEPGTKGRAGRYWATIPPDFEGLPDAPISEDFLSTSEQESAGKNDIPVHQCAGNRTESEQETEGKVNRKPKGKRPPFKPNPVPSPIPKKETFDPSTVDLPFASDRFRQSWGDYCCHRQHIKVPLTELAVTRLLNKCRQWGEDVAIASIDATIESGKWTGLFPPKGNHGTTNRQDSGRRTGRIR
jgi:hypothetical protein